MTVKVFGGAMRSARRCFMLVPFLSIVGLGGCATARGNHANGSSVVSSTAAGTLRATADAWARAADERDARAMSRYFADDLYAMYPHAPPARGAAANQAGWMSTFARPGVTHPIVIDTVILAASGDLGYTMGRWHLTAPAGTLAREARNVGGRFVAIWREVRPGQWRLVVLSAHEYMPPPAM